MPLRLSSRRGATLVEFAVVAPVVFFMVFSLLVGGLGVSRYQEVAYLAREASRWASVHGSLYASETNQPAADSAAIYNQVIVPKNIGLTLSKLTWSVAWNTNNGQYHTVVVNGNNVRRANTVTVSLSYVWIPELFLSQKTIRSTSVSIMSY